MIHIYVPLLPQAEGRAAVGRAELHIDVVINRKSIFKPIGHHALNWRSKGDTLTVLCRSAWYACSKGRISPGAVSHTTLVLLTGCQTGDDFEIDLNESVIRNRPDRVLMLFTPYVKSDTKSSLKRFIETEHGLHVETKVIV